MNKPNVNNEEDNPFTVFRTCLGDTLIEKVQVGVTPVISNTTNPGSTGAGGSLPSTNVVTDINGLQPSTITCQSSETSKLSFVEIIDTSTPITLTLNGSHQSCPDVINWKIYIFPAGVNQLYASQFSIGNVNTIPANDVTMEDNQNQTYNMATSYPLAQINCCGGSITIDITFSNPGNYEIWLPTDNCQIPQPGGGTYNNCSTASLTISS